MHRLDLASGQPVVLRRYLWPGFIQDEPEAPQREVDALQFALARGLPVPAVLAADPDGSAIGDGIPAVVMTHLAGKPRAVPDLKRLAELAASVHAIDASTFPHAYYRWYEGTVDQPPAGATDAGLWRRAIAIWRRRMPEYHPGFVHRDFHPGNVLWSRSVAHLVDWANACAGPWGCDIAHCRDNLIQLADSDVADDFLRLYLEITGESYDPYWEIASVLEHSRDGFTAEDIAGAERRLVPAVAAYST